MSLEVGRTVELRPADAATVGLLACFDQEKNGTFFSITTSFAHKETTKL